VRGDDDRLDRGEAEIDRAALDDGQFLVGHLDAEIAAGDHEAIAGGDDFLEIADRELVFDLGHDADLAVAFAQQAAQELDVGGLAHERHGNEVHVAFEGQLEVEVILFGQRGKVDLHAGQVDVASAAERTGGQVAADELVRPALFHGLHPEIAVIDNDDPADFDIVDQLRVIDVGGDRLRALLAFDREADHVANLEVDRLFHDPGADGGALGVQ
jgi:hypothetical protein